MTQVQATGDGPGRRLRVSLPSTSGTHGTAYASYKRTPYDFLKSFYGVLRRWRAETAFASDPDEITNHPSYKALVDNAQLITPLIVKELSREASLLVWVLEDAYGVVPYPAEARGDIQRMTDAWLDWAKKNGRTL